MKWTLAAGIVCVALFIIALSNEVYDLTSPAALSWHVLLRKSYSIAAFTIVGLLLRRAADERNLPLSRTACTLVVALYSGAIEIGQAAMGSHEGLIWNVADVTCGAIGGFLGWHFAGPAAHHRRG